MTAAGALLAGGGAVAALHLKPLLPAHASLNPRPGCFSCHGSVHCLSCHALQRDRAVDAARCASPSCHPPGPGGTPTSASSRARRVHAALPGEPCQHCHREHGGKPVSGETVHRVAEERLGPRACRSCH